MLIILLFQGNDLNSLIESILTKNECSDLNSNYELGLKNFAKLYIEESKKNRRKYIYCLRNAGLTIKDSNRIGFKVSKKLWRNCLNLNFRKGSLMNYNMKYLFLKMILYKIHF